jgi:hypothetical protein
MAPKKITASSILTFDQKIMIYGPPGCGKTFLAGSAQAVPALRDVMVLNLDGGAKRTLTSAEHAGIFLDDEARKAKDVEAELWKLASKAPGYETIKTLVLDGSSEVAKLELADIQAEAAKRGQRADADESQLRDFMIRQSRMLRVLRMARDIPGVTVILTAWAKEVFPKGIDRKDPAARPTQVAPDFTDAISLTLQGYMDAVWYLHEANGERSLVTQSHGVITAKTRGREFAQELGTTRDGKFVPVMKDPTLEKIFAAFTRAYSTKKEEK